MAEGPCCFSGKTIKQYALERLFTADADANQALEELSAVLASRIARGLAGDLWTKSVHDILNEELGEDRV